MNTCMHIGNFEMPTSIRLTPAIESRLNFLASETGRSKAYYLREIIERGLEDVEDYYLATHVAEAVRKGEINTYSEEQVRKELDLVD